MSLSPTSQNREQSSQTTHKAEEQLLKSITIRSTSPEAPHLNPPSSHGPKHPFLLRLQQTSPPNKAPSPCSQCISCMLTQQGDPAYSNPAQNKRISAF